jgi:hypothetical protein
MGFTAFILFFSPSFLSVAERYLEPAQHPHGGMIFFTTWSFAGRCSAGSPRSFWAIVESPKVKQNANRAALEDARAAAREISESGRLVSTEEKKNWSEPFYKMNPNDVLWLLGCTNFYRGAFA